MKNFNETKNSHFKNIVEKWKIIFLLVAISSTGCSFNTKLTQSEYDKYLNRNYTYKKEQCYKATITVLEEIGFVIDKQNIKSGKIITKRRNFKEQETVSSAKFVSTYDVNIGHKYYLTVSSKSQNSCNVKTDRFRIWYKGKELEKMNISWVNEHHWEPFFNEIGEKLNESI